MARAAQSLYGPQVLGNGNGPLVLGNEPQVLGNGNGLLVLGNGPHLLGIMSQFGILLHSVSCRIRGYSTVCRSA